MGAAPARRDPSAPRQPASPPPSAPAARASRRQHRPDHDGQGSQVPRGHTEANAGRTPAAAARRSGPGRRSAGRHLPRAPPPPRPRCRSPGPPGRTAPAPPRRARDPRARRARGTCRCVAQDRPERPRPPRPGGRRAARAADRRCPGRAWAAPRSPQPTRIRRSALLRFSCAMISRSSRPSARPGRSRS